MDNFGRVDKTFHRHPKAKKARALEPGSISLWLFANCFCRNHRRQGIISHAEAQELGTTAEINALLEAGLWRDNGTHYEFHDWRDWNPDTLTKTKQGSAIWLVQEVLPGFPHDAQARLADEVRKLMDEGLTTPVLMAALEKWRTRPDSPFSWLSYFASDAIRQGETGLAGAIKQARKTLNMAPLAEFGYRWQAPDPPDEAKSARAIRGFMREQKELWLDTIEASTRGESTSQR